MTTLVVQLSPELAKRLAGAADRLGWTHDEVARVAVREFLKAERNKEPAPRRRAKRV